VRQLQEENTDLKRALAETMLDVQRLKKRSWALRARYARMSAQQKLEILRAVEGSPLPVREALERLDVPPSTYYRWRRKFRGDGRKGWVDKPTREGIPWNRILERERGTWQASARTGPRSSARNRCGVWGTTARPASRA
jgi:transposase-like protein